MTTQANKDQRRKEREEVYALAMAEFKKAGGKVETVANREAPPIPTAK